MTELQFQEAVIKDLRKRGHWVEDRSQGEVKGTSDLLCCINGVFVVMELKIDDNQPSALQRSYCRKVVKSGGIALVLWGMGEYLKFIPVIEKHRWENMYSIAASTEMRNEMWEIIKARKDEMIL